MAAASRVGDPAESTRLRIGDEIAWSEISGVYDRDDSLKENTNPKCLLKNHPGANNGASQRFSGNLKPTAAPIIGLSGKLGQGGGRGRHHPPPPAIFPKKAKTGGGGRAPRAAVPEPGSPKVSCIGKVLSDRERARLGRPPRPRGDGGGCCGGLAFFMRRNRSRNSVECVDQSPPLPPVVETARRRETKEVEAASAAEVAAAAAPGLGGMRRFASGRRAAEWAAEMDGGDGRVASSGPL